ncbi:hypothetical protein JBO49_03205 [Serratia fonticola]|uniref:hypothetical protein n=1 Tax=Serratia fonticola TaxID=47917 RepID=UPI00192C4FE3|nr:hypothetical protein [Serratia fonticola]MBL5859620.1 hypothetical protein [Serratia fonticola]
MLNFVKTLTPDAIVYLAILTIFAALSVVFIVKDCRGRRETKRSNARREYLARKEAVERKARQQL